MRGYRLFAHRLKKYRWWVVGVVISIVVVDLIGLVPPRLIRGAVDYLDSGGDETRTLFLFAVLIIGVEIARATMRFTWRRIAFDFSRRVELDLRNEFFAKSVRLPPGFYDRTTVGDLMSRATSDIDQVRMFFGMGILTLFDTLTIIVTTAPLLFWLNPTLTLYTTLPLPILAILCWRIFMETHHRSRDVQDQFGVLTARVIENLSGIRVVKAFAREQTEIGRLRELSEEQVRLSMRLARMQAIFFPVFTIVLETGTLLVLWLGGFSVVRGSFSLGEFIQYSLYLGWLTGPMVGLGWTLSLYQRGIASMERLNELFSHPEPGDGASQGGEAGAIEYRGLTFKYDEALPEALHDVSFSVPVGSKVAIVGRTGSGKTTLAQLLPRLYEPPRGTVFLGGRDVRDISRARLRRLVSVVPQDAFLFSDTLAENIGFAQETLDLDRVKSATKAACLDDAVDRFPDGLEQIVGERGVTLSGGQKQRACLARAFATDAPVLVLDDAFSSVDAETEERVLAGLREAGKGRTLIVISHRLSSVKDADRIVVLDRGRVQAIGTHDELLKRGGIYADLWRKQQLQEALS